MINNTVTAAFRVPAIAPVDNANAAITGSSQELYCVAAPITVDVAQCDALTDAVVVTVWIEE